MTNLAAPARSWYGRSRVAGWPEWPPGWRTTSGSTSRWYGAIFAVLTALGLLGVVIYLAAWLLVPEAGTEVSIAEKIISKDGT